MREDSPKIVSLETSLELSEFPSEAEFTSEAEAPPVIPTPAQAAPITTAAPPPMSSNVVPLSTPEPRVEPEAPRPSAPVAAAGSVTSITAGIAREHVSAPETVIDPVRQPAHSGPAVVTEFPVKQQTPAAVAVPTLPSGPASLVELIERRNGFDWREAVAVIQQICLYLRDHTSQTPILLDPRTIQITDRGEVRLLSGQTSSDPLVIQVGRLLRTMLAGKEVPPELRLLLSQATFELPIFESIEDVDRALAQLNKLDEPGPAGLALLRAVAAPPPPYDPEQDFDQRPRSIRSIIPAQKRAGRRRSRRGLRFLLGGYGTHIAVIFVGIAVVAILLGTRPPMLFPDDTAMVQDTSLEAATPPVGGSGTSGAAVPAPEASRGERSSRADPSRRSPSSARRSDVAVTTPSNTRTAPEAQTHSAPGELHPGTGRPQAMASGTVLVTPPPPSPSAREHERRARELLEGGKRDEASLAFDGLVMNNPLYEPRTNEMTPEALATFRQSQRRILPLKAQGNYDRGKAALSGGDYDTALRLAREALAILDRHSDGASTSLRDQVEDLIEEAKLAAATATEVIYSESDLDVTPPRQLSRPMPINGPIGVPPNRVGWLDMIIGKDGTVFQVKLHTPLNRHHERMIVSPAKAWLYRPAMRNGRPVMYRIKVKVNLPESGTDF